MWLNYKFYIITYPQHKILEEIVLAISLLLVHYLSYKITYSLIINLDNQTCLKGIYIVGHRQLGLAQPLSYIWEDSG